MIQSRPAKLDPRIGTDEVSEHIDELLFEGLVDRDVDVARNLESWAPEPKIEQVRFAVVPDAITMALELEKGSADVEVNSLPMDVLPVLARRSNLEVADAAGTDIQAPTVGAIPIPSLTCSPTMPPVTPMMTPTASTTFRLRRFWLAICPPSTSGISIPSSFTTAG